MYMYIIINIIDNHKSTNSVGGREGEKERE